MLHDGRLWNDPRMKVQPHLQVKKKEKKSDVQLKMNQNHPPVKAVFSYLITSEYFPVSDDDNPASDIDAHLPL